MRIAQITSTYLSVPPRSHGGTELMVHHLVEGLASHGHDVELFASGDSRVSVRLNAVVPVATTYDGEATTYIDKEMEARNTHNLYRQASRFDIIHAHWPTLAPYFSGFARTPTVLTYAYIEQPLHEYYRATFPNVHPVCVSRRQAELLGEEGLPVVYNGIDAAAIPYNGTPEDFLVIVARITPNKGIAEAIRIAAAARERLVIVGDVTPYLPWSRGYYEAEVKPHVDGDRVRQIPHLPNEEVVRLVGRARAFLFPLQWEEPFGLAVVEAMAAGTPVIAYPRGAMPELVRHGETGFLVGDEAEAIEAVRRIRAIDRRRCRQWVEGQFDVERMVSGYEALYHRLAG